MKQQFADTMQSGSDQRARKTSDKFANDTKIQAKHPHRKRLMMPGKHRVGQVVEGAVAHPTKVALTVRMSFVVTVFDDLRRMTMRAFATCQPAKLPTHLVTFGVVDQSMHVDAHPA
jgi:hypothetical protein